MSAPYSPRRGSNSLGTAFQACTTCKRQKRRCDKALPACSLCRRMNRECDYSDHSPAPTAEDFFALRQKLLDLEGRLNVAGGGGAGGGVGDQPAVPNGHMFPPTPSTAGIGSQDDGNVAAIQPVYAQPELPYQRYQNRFPAIAFLDSEAFIYGQVAVPKPALNIPVEILDLLGESSAVQGMIREYFATTHIWLPIVSKKRLTQNMVNPLWEAGPDLALLFLCMKLSVTKPPDGIECSQLPIYGAAKRFLSLMEASGIVSVLVLQAYLLVGFYEMSQVIYPAAWMTAGSCGKYGMLLGLSGHKAAPQLLGRPVTWTAIEERRRTWWGVLILERVIYIGSMGRSLSTSEPVPGAYLPLDDVEWDLGAMTLSQPKTVSTPPTEPASPFSRLCQVTVLLGRIQRHHLTRPSDDDTDTEHTDTKIDANSGNGTGTGTGTGNSNSSNRTGSGGSATAHYSRAIALFRETSDLIGLLRREAAASPEAHARLAPAVGVAFATLCALCDPYACQHFYPRGGSSNSSSSSSGGGNNGGSGGGNGDSGNGSGNGSGGGGDGRGSGGDNGGNSGSDAGGETAAAAAAASKDEDAMARMALEGLRSVSEMVVDFVDAGERMTGTGGHRATTDSGGGGGGVVDESVDGAGPAGAESQTEQRVEQHQQQRNYEHEHEHGSAASTPLLLNALYAAAANYAGFVRESGDEGAQRRLDALRRALRRLGARWRCAAEYLRILEAQEFAYAVGGGAGTSVGAGG